MKCILLSAAAFAALTLPAAAGDALHAGSWTATITKQEVRPLGQDHIILTQMATGSNKSTGTEPRGDGAQALMAETVELKQGSGPQNGQFTLVDAKGSLTARYTGRVTTRMVDGKPETTGQGTWTHISSTGDYASVQETGSYAFTMTSASEMVGTWQADAGAAKSQ